MQELILSEQHSHAVELHQKILTSATLAQQNLWDMCTSLKEMRDGKLYKELGYSKFEDYCEVEVGMKHSNAYRYISIVERINPESFPPVGRIGIKKLALLATLSEEQQTEIAEKVTLEDTTYKELKAEIDKLKADKKATTDKLSQLETDAEALKNQRDGYSKQVDTLREKLSDTDETIGALKEKLSDTSEDLENAQNYIKELENRPVEIAVQESNNDRLLRETIESLERENIRQNERLEQQYREDEKKVRKMLEDDKQKALAELRDTYEQKLAELSEAPKSEPVDESKIKFKVYLTAAFDSLKRLTDFTAEHKNPIYNEKAKQLLNSVLSGLE